MTWWSTDRSKAELPRWKFTPSPDITAYELALILKCTLPELKGEIWVRDGGMIPPAHLRHFTEIKP